MPEFRMPSLGADMEAGTLVEWLVRPGDSVQRGDIVAVVETQKGAIEVEIFVDGMIEKFLVEPGEKVPVGTALAFVRSDGEAVAPTFEKEDILAPVEVARAEARLRISPAARRRAEVLGIDAAALTGTGFGGAVTVKDVEKAASVASAARAAPSMRDAIAAAMARSKREIPHYYLSATIKLHAALGWLETANRERPVTGRLLYAVLLVKAVAKALQDVPELNGMYVDGAFRQSKAVNLGFAVSLRGGGLVAPALLDAGKKDLDTLMAELRDLVARARAGRLKSSAVSEPTITLTNLGEQGVDCVFPVIYPPQVAIVGFGSIVERPWFVDDEIISCRVVTASLAADHRVSDGHRGAVFLRKVDQFLQEPDKL